MNFLHSCLCLRVFLEDPTYILTVYNMEELVEPAEDSCEYSQHMGSSVQTIPVIQVLAAKSKSFVACLYPKLYCQHYPTLTNMWLWKNTLYLQQVSTDKTKAEVAALTNNLQELWKPSCLGPSVSQSQTEKLNSNPFFVSALLVILFKSIVCKDLLETPFI